MENKKEVEDLNFCQDTLGKIVSKKEQERNFNLGILFGLFLGLVGNLIVNLVYELYIKNLSPLIKLIILFLTSIISIFVIIKYVKKIKNLNSIIRNRDEARLAMIKDMYKN